MLSGKTFGGNLHSKRAKRFLTHDMIVEELEGWDEEWLLVFDNYDDTSSFDLNEYIPKLGKGTVLITTRDARLGQDGWKRIPIPEMREEEALRLLLPDTDYNTLPEEDARACKEIVSMLGYLPLAIDQTRWFFSQFNFTSQMREYVEVFNNYKNNLIDAEWGYKRGEESRNWYTTFEQSFEAIASTKYGKLATHILTISAFFGGASLREDFFSAYFEADSRWIQSLGLRDKWDTLYFRGILAELVQRSLIRLENNGRNCFSLHPIIREWLRVRPESRRYDYLSEAVLILVAYTKSTADSSLPFRVQQDLLVHLESFLGDPVVQKKLSFRPDNESEQASLVMTFASVYRTSSHLREAKKLLQGLIEARRESGVADSNPVSIELQIELGETFIDDGEYTEAREHFSSVLKYADKLNRTSHCRTLLGFADTLGARGDFRAAYPMARQAQDLAATWAGVNSRLNFRAIFVLARIQAGLGRLIEVGNLVNGAYDRAYVAFGSCDRTTLEASYMRAGDMMARLDFDTAKSFAEQTLVTSENLNGPDHRLTLNGYISLGYIYGRQGLHSKARNCFEVAKSRAGSLFGGTHADVMVELTIGETYFAEHNYEEAEKQFQSGKNMSEKIHDTTMEVACTVSLFRLYFAQKKFRKAIPMAWVFVQNFPFRFFFRTNKTMVISAAVFGLLLVISGLKGYFMTVVALVSLLLVAVWFLFF
ncbi:TPR-like protein [Mytilinidion resinicola]|uniref:TPR-like protein n=1 Tax=Mytilinidion resinicola TaxID=574789 RepID=A0A6A6YN78_9PEZI|nr:TPR-like protein [Mytilinidion resinicola]KAF2809425.1 TPR-like protein [Mytilinidion resinicola]